MNILSIDGGGIRGIIPAMVLAEIEKKTGKRIAEMFDLITGTSTGGILALGLSKNGGGGEHDQYSAEQLVELYEKKGKRIFCRSLLKKVSSLGGLLDQRYSSKGLKKVLEEYFGAATLENCLVKTMVTTYDLQERGPLFLKSWKCEHRSVKMKHAARATAAAPTYFEPIKLCVGSKKRTLIDGGLFINTPAVSAYVSGIKEAEREKKKEKAGNCKDTNFFVVSLGTGRFTPPIPLRKAKKWGRLRGVRRIIRCMFDGMSDAANYQMDTLLGCEHIRLHPCLSTEEQGAMDKPENIPELKELANRLIKTEKAQIKRICKQLQKSTCEASETCSE